MLNKNNRESVEESEYGKDSYGVGLSHEMDIDDGVAENELHVKIIVFIVESLQKERNRSRYYRLRAPEAKT